MDAQGALDSFLGRISAVLANEAQLLGGVRGDVEFIKEEMECMNSLILQLTDAQHRDYLVRAWMRQVVGVTRDCEGNVELYIHYVGSRQGNGGGVLGHLRGAVRFLRTVLARHRIATRIQELKVHTRNIGDRRQRYGVIVPASAIDDAAVWRADDEEDRFQRRAVLLDATAEPPADQVIISKGIASLIKWLHEEPPPPPPPARDQQHLVRLFSIAGWDLALEITKGLYQHESVATLFSCKVLVKVSYQENACTTLAKIVKEVSGVQPPGPEGELHIPELARILQGHLNGMRFLIIIEYVDERECKRILDPLLHAADGCRPGSAIIITKNDGQVVLSSPPYKVINARNLWEFYANKANKLKASYSQEMFSDSPHSSAFARKMFLHLLYVNPSRINDLEKYSNAAYDCRRLNKSISSHLLLWCYNELPSKYRSCLLYLTIFSQKHIIKATSLARRWVAEGLVAATTTSDENHSVMDEAVHYLDVLFTRGFVSPVEISATGNIKSFIVHHEVHKFIAMVARDVNFVEKNLPPELTHHLSIHNRIVLQKVQSDGGGSKDIVASLPSLASSPQWQLLKVLDLEGCHGLEKHHLRIICKVLLLKYLSLRNTDVAELPKQIKELQCLETLDVRQTKVRVLSKKPIVLPQLKRFLAGHKVSAGNDARVSDEEPVATVSMPLGIQRMESMEILSHVQVTNSASELAGIAQLLKLRKFGVTLHGENAKLNDLFRYIEKLDACLHSLSIRIVRPDTGENHDAEAVDALNPPQFIKNLNVSGLTRGLPHLIQELHQLDKLTLTEIYMKEDALRILGKLGALRCLRLQYNSYMESELALEEEEFQSLNFLLVASSNVTNIRFAVGAAPKLERIVWCFPATASLSGLRHLHKLREFELNGDCSTDQVRDEMEGHINFPVFKHNPHAQR